MSELRPVCSAGTYDSQDIVIVQALRSIIGSCGGSLRDLDAAHLGAHVAGELLSRLESDSPSFVRDRVPQLIVGLCVGTGTGQNLPRQIAALCGMGPVESAYVVNEMCGSSIEAVISAVCSIRAGDYSLVLAGGVESPSGAPFLISRKQLVEWRDRRVEEIQDLVVGADMYDALWCRMHDVHTIVHAEDTTREWAEAGRQDPEDLKRRIDEYAVLSNDRALKAVEEGIFREETILIPRTSGRDELPVKRKLAFLQKRQGTRYTPDGRFLTSWNSPAIADGAAFLMLMTYEKSRELGLEPMGRIRGYARAGVEPEKFLLAPPRAVISLLKKTGLAIGDFDLLEMNTAFGSQILMNQAELGLDMNRVNCWGDAVALGHPVGAAGARLLTTLLHALKRENRRLGLVSICLGGGNALALAVERLSGGS